MSEIKVFLFAFVAVCGLQGAVSKVSIPSKKVKIYYRRGLWEIKVDLFLLYSLMVLSLIIVT